MNVQTFTKHLANAGLEVESEHVVLMLATEDRLGYAFIHLRGKSHGPREVVDVFRCLVAPYPLSWVHFSVSLGGERSLRSYYRIHASGSDCFTSPFGLAMVLLGCEPEAPRSRSLEVLLFTNLEKIGKGSNLVSNHLGRHLVAGQFLVSKSDTPPQVKHFARIAFTEIRAGAGVWFFLSRINALTILLAQAKPDETDGVEARITFETMALLRDLTNFGLALV
ncbi:hypothetical protein Tco_0841867 [Tanacetum coccineum]|uniref:Uncharacterized protein n=1 Tax=Tanacetum coccineum TaxID=301880 RepID=A0ABQ5AY77_9ASTR